MRILALIGSTALLATAGARAEHLSSIAQYLPPDCPTDGALDLTGAFTRALAEQADRRAWRYFGGVDSQASVWFNGEWVGEHDVGNEPFSSGVTGKVVAGASRFVVRSHSERGLAGVYKPIAVVVD
ncbi:MAG: hypothetical protein AB7Y46_00075 [Armatimonadota bacterium]